jgi:hypothetical protein
MGSCAITAGELAAEFKFDMAKSKPVINEPGLRPD